MILVNGDIQLSSKKLRVGEVTHSLTPMEARLLAFLMETPNELRSKRDIMKGVWNTSYMGDTRTMHTHICWLKKKVGSDRLGNVREKGYKFVSDHPTEFRDAVQVCNGHIDVE
jgi:DNA-binding response OmpR family regulator